MMKTSQMTYRPAMAELTDIVNRLRDSEDIDVDELVTDVARAKELIRFCDSEIKKAGAAIQGIVLELQTVGEAVVAVPTECLTSSNGDGEDFPF